MNKDADKTKEQLLAELEELRKESKEQKVKLKAASQQLRATEQQLRSANQQLNESEAKYKKLSLLKKVILESPEGIVIFALDKNYCYIDFTLPHKQTMKEIWGVDIEIGGNMLDYIKFKPDREKAKKNFDKALKGEQFVFYEEYGDEKFKRTFYEGRYSPVYDENNNIIGLLVYVIDITERKQVEEKLKESEETFKGIFNNTTDAIYLQDEDGAFLDVNQGAVNMYGYTREELIGNTPEMVSAPVKNDLKMVKGCIQKAFNGEPQQFEFWGKRKNGEIFPKIVRLSAGNYFGKKIIIAFATDITERKQAEEKLRAANQQYEASNQQLLATEQQLRVANQQLEASNQQLRVSEIKMRNLFNAMQDIVFEMDYNGTYLNVAPTSLQLMVKPAEETTGKTLHDFFPKQQADLFLKFIQKCIDENKPAKIIYPINFGNKTIWFEGRANPIGNKRVLYIASDITERKQAEEELEKNEKKYRELSTLLRLMADNMSDMLWAKNLNNEYIFVNKAICTDLLSARDTSEPLGKTDIFFARRERNAHPDNPEWHTFGEICMDSDAAILEAMKPMHFDEYGNVRGKFLFLDVHKAPLYDDDGRLIGIVGSARDVTTAKESENQLRKLSTAVKQSPSVIVITDTNGNVEYINPKFTEITGYSFDEVIGHNPRILKSGEHPVEMYKELWDTISSGKTWHGEIHNKKKNGELFWEMASVSPIFDEKGHIINYIKVAEDITKQKRNEQIQSIIHNISNAVITGYSSKNFLTLVKDELGKLIDTTNFFVASHDEKTDSISLPLHHDEKDKFATFPEGKTLTNYVIKTGKSLLAKKAMIEKLIKSGEVEQIGHLSKVWLGVPLKSHNKITGILAVQSYDDENAYDEADVKILEIISHQISLSLERLKAEEDLKLAKEKAEESDRLKSAFLANMSHEIRTPMNGILGFTSLLLNPDYSSEEKEEFIKMIHQSGQRMLDTVTEIVEISKIEAGIITTEWQEIHLNSILKEQIMFFSLEAQKKGLELVLEQQLPKDKSSIITDKHKFEAILINLVKNAIKYTDKGRINVGAKLKNDFVEFYVQDTGIGVPKNRRKAIFNRFEQADIGDARAFEGSGLGLAISKAYVEMLGGEIRLESEENKGSVFYFTIPVKKEKKVKPMATSKEQTASNDNNAELFDKELKVLVAEDDEESFVYLTIILKKYNWNIIRTATGRQTIEKFKEQPDIDLILMDIKLPDLDGYKAARQIKAINPEVPIIAQTAYALEGDRQKALDAGCDEYIAKPIKKEILIEKIRACLEKKSI